MKRLLSFILLLPLTLHAAWPQGDYTEVRAFAYNLKGETHRLIIEDGKLSGTVANKNGVLLTPRQIKNLVAAVASKHPKHPHAACFVPRHAFVFYDATHTPFAWLEVCFECLNVNSVPDGADEDVDFPALAELCRELDLPSSPGKDFRKGFEDFRPRQ